MLADPAATVSDPGKPPSLSDLFRQGNGEQNVRLFSNARHTTTSIVYSNMIWMTMQYHASGAASTTKKATGPCQTKGLRFLNVPLDVSHSQHNKNSK